MFTIASSTRGQDSDTDPREEYVHHNAGLDGHGGSSYIDDAIFRDRDTDASGAHDERIYYCQNWRHDVVAMISPTPWRSAE